LKCLSFLRAASELGDEFQGVGGGEDADENITVGYQRAAYSALFHALRDFYDRGRRADRENILCAYVAGRKFGGFLAVLKQSFVEILARQDPNQVNAVHHGNVVAAMLAHLLDD
jgi:hypothetical protein